jgi:SAM-dependent methyltransferase
VVSDRLFARFYPGTSHDGTLAFYGWLRAHCAPRMRVLNLGAGPATKSPKRLIKGSVASVTGVDIDPVVLTNEELDEAYVTDGVVLPFTDHSFDLAYADYVLEHVEHPVPFLSEVKRVLKPGAAFFFRTPNIWHYVALISASTPHWVHRLIANPVRGMPRDAHEPYLTRYRLNSKKAIVESSAAAGFSTSELRFFEGQPSYLMFNSVAFLLGVAYERIVNSGDWLAFLRANIFGKLVKLGDSGTSHTDSRY